MAKKKEPVLELETTGKWSLETFKDKVHEGIYGTVFDECIVPSREDEVSFESWVKNELIDDVNYCDLLGIFLYFDEGDLCTRHREVGAFRTRIDYKPISHAMLSEVFKEYFKHCDEIKEKNKQLLRDWEKACKFHAEHVAPKNKNKKK